MKSWWSLPAFAAGILLLQCCPALGVAYIILLIIWPRRHPWE